MANPQTGNGFTQLANEVLEALAKTRIPGEARQLLDFVIRKTYGYHKTEDVIATVQFKEGTGLTKRAIERGRATLREMNLIATTQKGGSQALSYRFNKDYDTWNPMPKKEYATTQKGGRTTTKKGGELPPKKQHTKDNKDNVNIKTGAKSAPLINKHQPENPEVKQEMDEVTKAGLNIYAMVYKAKQSMKQPKNWHFPDLVILRVCETFHKEKDRIRQPWPWFVEVLKRESERWNAEQHEIESKTANKRAPFANSIKSIMGGAK